MDLDCGVIWRKQDGEPSQSEDHRNNEHVENRKTEDRLHFNHLGICRLIARGLIERLNGKLDMLCAYLA